MIIPVTVTLVYANGSTWFAGQFQSLAAANAWVAIEQTRPYWVQTTIVQIVEVV